jgi:hypothetical protein
VRAVAVAIVGVALLAAACKNGRWQKNDRDQDRQAAGAVVQPQRTGAADATGIAPLVFDLDTKTGHTRQSLILRLDYFPGQSSGGANLPACYGAFARDFELGVFQCEGQPEKSQPLRAGHVSQDCYTNPRFQRVPVATPIELRGCSRGILKMHAFDPQLRIDVEQM